MPSLPLLPSLPLPHSLPRPAVPTGLYAITRDVDDTALLLGEVAAALTGGLKSLQYRNKAASKALRLAQAHALRAITREYGATLIVNDDLDLAVLTDADGVHFGRDEIAQLGGVTKAVAAALSARLQVGISCYDQLSLAKSASSAGADYVAFGACFPSTTKPFAVAADLKLIAEVKRAQTKRTKKIVVVAIGGITVDNVGLVIGAGADAAAVVLGLWGAADIATRVHAFNRQFVA